MHSYGRQRRAAFHTLRPRVGWSFSVQVEVKSAGALCCVLLFGSQAWRLSFRAGQAADLFAVGPRPRDGPKRPKHGPNHDQPCGLTWETLAVSLAPKRWADEGREGLRQSPWGGRIAKRSPQGLCYECRCPILGTKASSASRQPRGTGKCREG